VWRLPPQGPNGLQQATWGNALAAIAGAAHGLGPNQFKAIAGKLADAESMIALKVGRCLDSLISDMHSVVGLFMVSATCGSVSPVCLPLLATAHQQSRALYAVNHLPVCCT
jgi:hypothetical protein